GVFWTREATSAGKLVVLFWLKLLSGVPATICQQPETASTCAKFWTSTSLNTDMYTMMKVTIANIATAIPVRNFVDIGYDMLVLATAASPPMRHVKNMTPPIRTSLLYMTSQMAPRSVISAERMKTSGPPTSCLVCSWLS